MQWFPDSNNNENWTVSPSEIFLAKRGVDISQLDIVGKHINGPFSHELKRSFFQILSACVELSEKDFPSERVSFTECLVAPKANLASAITVRGKVRRVEKVLITDPLLKKTIGKDHYYQLQLFSPLENQRISIKQQRSGKNASNSPTLPFVHENRYPVTVCVTELPVDEKSILKRTVSISGFFFKLWNYVSMATDSENSSPIQVVPLIIGSTPELAADGSSELNFWLSAIGIIGVLATIVLLWFYGPGDSNARRNFESQTRELPDTIEIRESPEV